MMLYSTPAAMHLAPRIAAIVGLKQGRIAYSRFPDCEVRVQVLDQPKKRSLLLAGWPAPAENLLEALFAIDALQSTGSTVDLVITYFGYCRQDKPPAGEAAALRLVLDALSHSGAGKVWTVDLHFGAVKQASTVLKARNLVPTELWAEKFQGFKGVVLAPDAGYKESAVELSKKLRSDFAWIEKKRDGGRAIALELHGRVHGKDVLLVDDMVSTGETIERAATLAKREGAGRIVAAATHAVLAPGHDKIIEKAQIERLWLTNTLNRKSKSPKVRFVDASEWLASRIARTL